MPNSPTAARLPPEALPDNIASVQPGGGFGMRVELAWGRLRRRYLRTFRRGYVRRMAEKRRGDCPGCPHEVLDPRDLKYCCNRCGFSWDDADDPFRWREKIPFARWGLAELQLMGWPLLAATVALALSPVWYLAVVPGLVLLEIVWFFRDPPRKVPQEAGLVVSPADGKVVEITRLENAEFVGGPAVRIGIFLSIFNVHINRSPLEARCIAMKYTPGKYLNALNPQSALENEAMWIALEEETPPHRRLVVRQIAGTIARRIVCDLRPGQTLARGQKFGMIKLGSRTEIILPDDGSLRIQTQVGERVKAGRSVLARYV
ncbi:MAG: phosphatidylserine decarboxylase family protein [Planctomycetia bacterium]|nr:phosphatidylserine decarboxylase family protein [Planctomycetia bacterium]